jgi:hypothetical protein
MFLIFVFNRKTTKENQKDKIMTWYLLCKLWGLQPTEEQMPFYVLCSLLILVCEIMSICGLIDWIKRSK